MSRLHTVSIYLLKQDVTTPGEALREDVEDLTRHVLTAPGAEGVVFLGPVQEREPDWVGLLAPVTDPPVQARSQTTNAVLVLNTAERWFAITFGHGRTFLDPERYERRFGLKAALNSVDPALLRGAQARTFNDHALHTQRQVSRLSRIEALELDVERDLVVALGGTLADEDLGRRLEGRDAARLTAELDASTLVTKCAELLRASEQTGYRRDFPWIDTIEDVTDPAKVAELESRAAEQLGRRQFAAFDLFPPELVSDEIVSYQLWPSHGGLLVIEPDANLLRYPLSQPLSGGAAKRALKHYRLVGIDANGDDVGRWPLWDCLHAEFTIDGRRIVLDGGRWYRIAKSFADDVDNFVAALPSSQLSLPAAKRDETEGDYNSRAATATGFALLDQQTIRLPGRTAIEACDLFAPSGELIHIKRRKGGSGPLSHLIGQAAVSAELLLGEPDFRTGIRKRLATAKPGFEKHLAEPVLAASHPIILGLITNTAATGKVASDLPFFTKVFLRQNARRLQNMGFQVFVDEISVATPQVSSRTPTKARKRRGRGTSAPQPVRPPASSR